jgi:RNA polymerase sigma factor (sigma-70 family)
MSLPPSTPISAPPCALPSVPPDGTKWFKEEVHIHDGQLKSWLKGQFPTIRDVDDVVQESYLRVWKVRATREITSAKAFLFTIARNLTLNLIRANHRSRLIPEGEKILTGVIDQTPSAADLLTSSEMIEILTDALAALPDRTRTVLLLHKFQGIPQAEVARQLNLTPKTVEHQVSRGVEKFGKLLRERGYEIV